MARTYPFSKYKGIQPATRESLDALYNLGGLPFIRGTWYYVDKTSGASTNSGTSPENAFNNILTAYTACTDGAGDGIVIISRGSTSAATTSYLTAVIDWTKSGITTVGVAAPVRMFGRARIANDGTSGLDLAYLVDVQGANNTFINIHAANFGTDAAAIGCWKDTGARNAYINCHFVGGLAAGAAATHRNLELNASEEATFINCTFGTDTVDRGNNASYDVLITGATARAHFEGCRFVSYVSTGTAHGAVKLDTTSGGRHCIFVDCTFDCFATTQAAVFLTNGALEDVFVRRSSAYYTAWGASGAVYVDMPTTAASAGGGLATTS
jgi:hypothetical protein